MFKLIVMFFLGGLFGVLLMALMVANGGSKDDLNS